MASSKNYTEVLIGGKVFTLSGFESDEYIHSAIVRDIASRAQRPEVFCLL